MKISTNALTFNTKKYKSVENLLPKTLEELEEKIGAQLGAIEETIDNGSKYEEVVVAKVITCVQHPNADRLHVCTIDDGGNTPDVNRGENGLIQVVCGAPNVREGLMVAWLPPGSTVPDSVGRDPFVLEARELRGVMSNGMLASAKELAIGDSHDGILELDSLIVPGTTFAHAYDIENDHVIDIENKMFTHRPDCFGWLGVAREIAGIQGKAFKSPLWYTDGTPEVYKAKSSESLPLNVENKLPKLVPRFVAVTMSNIEVKPSPIWLQVRLSTHGIRPINNVVDITNFLMLETGQPMHAYDYDKVLALDKGAETATIAVRAPKKVEKLELLNGKTITPHENAILIASATSAIGLGGVMGGSDTEVSETTRNIILECASFDMYSIRRTSMAQGIFTDAVTRFTKGQTPLQNRQVTEKAMEMLEKYAGAKYVKIYDDDHTVKNHIIVPVTDKFINDRLGLNLKPAEIKKILENVEFTVNESKGNLKVLVPFWRTDIEIAEDVVEEVGRLYGYDRLPLVLPNRSLKPAQRDLDLETKAKIRQILSSAGANEVLTYSFVHNNLLTKVGQNPEEAFSLGNALSPDLQYYRLSITPSLLEKVHPNIKQGYGEFAIFEIGKGHEVNNVDSDLLPKEWTNIALSYATDSKNAKNRSGAPFYQARKYLADLMVNLNIDFKLMPFSEAKDSWEQITVKPFNPERTATVIINNKVAGYVGEYNQLVINGLKLPDYSAGFEVKFEEIVNNQKQIIKYVPLSKFPAVEQDITFRVNKDLKHIELAEKFEQIINEFLDKSSHYSICSKDIYQPEGVETKNVTFGLRFVNYSKTMTDQEINQLLSKVCTELKQNIKFERI